MDLRSGISIRKRKKVYTASDVHQQVHATRLPVHPKINNVIKPVQKRASCRDICCNVKKKDESIGTATVYRMIRVLEEIGVIDRIDIVKLR